MAIPPDEPDDYERAERQRAVGHYPAIGIRVSAINLGAVLLNERIGHGLIGEPRLLHFPDLRARRLAETTLPGRHHAVGVFRAASALARNMPRHPPHVITHQLRLGLRDAQPRDEQQKNATFPPSHASL